MNTLPRTKFRVPRPRDGSVERVDLLERLERSVAGNVATLVCAPGGSGKTTVLAQLAARAQARGDAVVWIAIDEDDDDANRLFATLVHGLEPLSLAWETPPRELVARVVGAGAQTRSALAAAVNALCTSAVARVLIVFDDLHRIAGVDTFGLLESLIERLPDHVTLLLGTRQEPDLPLARWRVHGEIGEFSLADLRFSAAEAAQLAEGDAHRAATPEQVEDAWRRSQGWAVGLTMLLNAQGALVGLGRTRTAALGGEASQRKLFAYLAQEVLDRLPEDLRDFVLRVSVLTELSPPLCEALTGRDDSAAVLEELYRRDLFLSVVDDATPVLRFHDLFREFLELELSRRLPDEVRSLHERAARAEETSARAIHHYLKAELWEEASWLILRVGERLIAEGALTTVERWIDQIPPQARRGEAHLAYLRGSCAWLRWDFIRAREELVPAIAGLTAPLEAQSRIRASFQLVDALSSSGDLQEARRRLDDAAAMPLDDLGRAEHALLSAWCHAAGGELEAVTRDMLGFVHVAEREPERICPVTAGRIHCLLIGLPGVSGAYERFAAASRRAAGPRPAPWQLAAAAVEGVSLLWHGEFERSAAALRQAEVLYRQFGSIRLVAERLGQLRAIHATACGRLVEAITFTKGHIEDLQSAPELERHRVAWLRAYRHALARMYWIAGRQQEFVELLPVLTAPRTAAEWLYVDVAADVVRGQAALLRGEPQAALEPLTRAGTDRAQHCLPFVFSDPRIVLAYAWLSLRERAKAWEVFEPVYAAAIEHREFGPLLLEQPVRTAALLDAMPSGLRASAATGELRATLGEWTRPSTADGSVPAVTGPLARLTEREREVLAAVAGGAGNKHIARALDLSLHTVKRHIANILDKLDCASRGQAADLYRRATG